MPRLKPDLIQCAFYLYMLEADGIERIGPRGTGSIVCRIGSGSVMHYYAVTSWHLAGRGSSIIRLNTRDGKHRWLDYEPHEWRFVTKGHDVVAIDITDDLEPEDLFFAIPESLFVTRTVQSKYEVAPGEDVFMIGMFGEHFGKDRNIPAVRFGNLSVAASDDNPVKLENKTSHPSHLADMRSRGGFSGSPVFLIRNHLLDLGGGNIWHRDLSSDEAHLFRTGAHFSTPKDTFVGFLGVHCGQYWDRVDVRTKRPEETTGEQTGDPVREGDWLYIQSGMTIIAPAWRVQETLDLEPFEQKRKAREAKCSSPRDRDYVE